MGLGGINKYNRELLSSLNRSAKGPFDLGYVAKTLNIPKAKVRYMVKFWAKQGWLTRIKRGLYSTVSLSTLRPEAQKEDAWVIAEAVFKPCYIGGWSACEHWGFTEQIFNDIVVFSSRRFNRNERKIQGTNYIINTVNMKRFYGLKPIWRGTKKISVSDPSRTIIDILDNPKLGGGMRNVADMLNEYFNSENRNDKTLIEYISRYGNRVVYKRLGYLIEYLNINAPDLIKTCNQLKSAGYTKLDPTLPLKGKIVRRWNLRLNTNLEGALK
jgi:predicted transcriptional regulator of viral defense system